jgi:hypothetical protein
MKYEIEEEVVKLADKCSRTHVCLTGEDALYCKVAILMKGTDEEIPLLECFKGAVCPYSKSFGETYICRCPLRREIYIRYEK